MAERNDVISFIKEMCPDLEQWKLIWVENMLDIIKEDKDMPNEGTAEKKEQEIWEFLKKLSSIPIDDYHEWFGFGYLWDNFATYEEVKDKYDEYMRISIRPGDYVRHIYEPNRVYLVLGVEMLKVYHGVLPVLHVVRLDEDEPGLRTCSIKRENVQKLDGKYLPIYTLVSALKSKGQCEMEDE